MRAAAGRRPGCGLVQTGKPLQSGHRCHLHSQGVASLGPGPDAMPPRLPGAGLHHPVLVREDDRLHTVADFELREHARDMRLDGRRLDDELGRDLGIRQAASEQAQDVSLPGGQLVERRVRRRPPRELLDQTARARRGEQCVTVVHRVNRRDELVRGRRLQQEPRRAGPERVDDVLVEVECREHQHANPVSALDDAPSGVDPVQPGHADVHQHDVRSRFAGTLDGLVSVARLPDHLEVRLGVEDQPETGSHERLVVGEQNADHAPTGKRARTSKPPPARRPASSSPPQRATRSRMPTSPCPVPVSVPVPSPSSVTSTSTAPRSYRTTTVACARPAFFRAFVSASWTMRYAERSIPGGRGTGDPSTRNSTGSPASRTFAISRSRSRSVGCGDSARPSSLRTTPIRRRISSTVCRPVPSIASSAVRTSCWLPSSTRAAAPACTTIIETLWAITSWSSRAIRARSTATAACACSSRCASSRWVRSSSSAARRRQRRIRRPTNQVATSHTVDGTTLPESWPREIAIPPNPARNASDAAGASTTARPVVLLPSEQATSTRATNG